jgi:hypothetical protein
MTKERKTLSFSTQKKQTTDNRKSTYPSFTEIPAGHNPANYVLINGRYFFNDIDTTGNYLRSVFLS